MVVESGNWHSRRCHYRLAPSAEDRWLRKARAWVVVPGKALESPLLNQYSRSTSVAFDVFLSSSLRQRCTYMSGLRKIPNRKRPSSASCQRWKMICQCAELLETRTLRIEFSSGFLCGGLQVELPQLTEIYFGWRLAHEVLTAIVLRKCDNFPDAVLVAEQHDKSV